MKQFETAESITLDNLNQKNKKYQKSDLHKVTRHALANNTIASVANNLDNAKENNFTFSVDIKTMTAPNQKASGRCWIFAACNVLREMIGKELGIKNFELSQSYVAFYDRLEKINYLLESVIDFVEAEHDERTLYFLLENGIGDGGQWDMFVNIIKKYGICPKQAMPETFQSSNTGQSNMLINFEIRKFAGKAQKLYKEKGIEAVRKEKEQLLDRFYTLLLDCYGAPVEKFDFEYRDKDDNYQIIKDLTPKSFFEKFIGSKIDDYVSIINAPTKDKPFYHIFTISYLGNVLEGKPITHLNVPMNRFIELTINQLKDGEVCWFGCDCSRYSDRPGAIWDDKSWDYATPWGLDYAISKEDGLDYKASVMNHAMVISGVDLKDDKPIKWKIENSWGTDGPFAGYHVMSNSWFEKYTYQVVINKKYLNKKELKALEEDLIVLKPWDPMGTLA